MLFRKLLPLFAPALVLLSAATAKAQFGVYATVTGERTSGFTCTDPSGICASTGGVERPFGANFGAYYDFRNLGPARLGVDVRGGVLNTNKSAEVYTASTDLIRQYSFLGGVRASFATPIKYIRPYGEVAVGYAKFGPVYAYNNYVQAEGLVGVDVPILPFLDIRAIELGAGALFGPSTHGLQSIGAGLVFHTTR